MNQQSANPVVNMLIPLVVVYIIFYFVLFRPQRKAQKEREDMINSLKKNDEIVTTGGIHGTIVNVKEKTFVLRVDDDTKLEIDKSAIGYLKRKATE